MHNYVFDISICMVSNMLVDSFRVNVDNMVYMECMRNRCLIFRRCFAKQFDTNPQCINCFAKMVSEAATLAVFQQGNVDLCRYYVVIVRRNICVYFVFFTICTT